MRINLLLLPALLSGIVFVIISNMNTKRYNTLRGVLFLFAFITASSLFGQQDLELSKPLTAKALDMGVMLQWQASTNLDAEFFVIEKSKDGLEFEAIGETPIQSDNASYRYLDVLARSNPIHYRISIYNSFSEPFHSDIVRVDNSTINNFMVSRLSNVNTDDTFEVDIESFIEGDLTFKVKNRKGEVYSAGNLILIPGTNQLSIDVSGAEPSIYKLILTMKEEREILTFERIEGEKEEVASDKEFDKD